MGKSTPQTATTTQQTNMGPWKPQQPYLTKAFGEAESLYDNYSPEYFKGSTVAGATPNQLAGWDQTAQLARQGNPLIPAAQGMTLDTINGKFLDPSSNPYLADTYGQAADAVTRSYQTATAPGTSAAFSAGGRYGSGARNQQIDQNNRALGSTLYNLATSIYGGNYEAERARQMTAAGGAPGMVQAGYIEPGMLTSVGQQQQQQQQAELTDDVARWNYEQQLHRRPFCCLLRRFEGRRLPRGASGPPERAQGVRFRPWRPRPCALTELQPELTLVRCSRRANRRSTTEEANDGYRHG